MEIEADERIVNALNSSSMLSSNFNINTRFSENGKKSFAIKRFRGGKDNERNEKESRWE